MSWDMALCSSGSSIGNNRLSQGIWKAFCNNVSLLYEGMQMGFAGSYSYSRYSYTFGGNGVIMEQTICCMFLQLVKN